MRPRSLWFGFAASAFAWVLLGCLDLVITLLACTHQGRNGIPGNHPNASPIFIVISLILLVVAIASGIISYRNWRRLSVRPGILDSPAVERREFMAVIGVIVSITLGMGIIWLTLPPFFLDICWRAK
ncbi:MAG TPA: hypothetical protein VFW25_12585 [Silvibacterium sp.]|nr:hypothetical protein [Silvibacterium sp.]